MSKSPSAGRRSRPRRTHGARRSTSRLRTRPTTRLRTGPSWTRSCGRRAQTNSGRLHALGPGPAVGNGNQATGTHRIPAVLEAERRGLRRLRAGTRDPLQRPLQGQGAVEAAAARQMVVDLERAELRSRSGPQAIGNSTVYTGADMYRQLLGHAGGALAQSGPHATDGHDLIGEIAPRGLAGPGLPNASPGRCPSRSSRPVLHRRQQQELAGKIAKRKNGCPGNASNFHEHAEPGALQREQVRGPSVCPGRRPACQRTPAACSSAGTTRPRRAPPATSTSPRSRLEQLLRHLAGRTYPIWSTEFGYWTVPPDSTHNRSSATKRSARRQRRCT